MPSYWHCCEYTCTHAVVALLVLWIGTFDRALKFLRDLTSAAHDVAGSGINVPKHLFTVSASHLDRTIVLEPLHCSCLVYCPPLTTVGLDRICAEAGYVHSCGEAVYAEQLASANVRSLERSINSHISAYRTSQRSPSLRLFFVPYTHEDFSPHDRHDAQELSGGLDQVKISMEKAYLGDRRLLAVIEGLRDRFGNKLVIPGPGDSRETHTRLRSTAQKLDKRRTLWLLFDRSVPTASDSESRYHVVCYAQIYHNENAFFIFKENKPAWITHTTLPHTLAAAMINLTQPLWPKRRPVKMVDPFVGTGTTALECLKFNDVTVQAFDHSPMTKILLEDNFQFFSMNHDALSKVQKLLAVEPRLRPPKDKGHETMTDVDSIYEEARRLASQVRVTDDVFPRKVVDALRGRASK